MDTFLSVMGSLSRRNDTSAVDGDRSRESTAPRRDKRNFLSSILNADDQHPLGPRRNHRTADEQLQRNMMPDSDEFERPSGSASPGLGNTTPTVAIPSSLSMQTDPFRSLLSTHMSTPRTPLKQQKVKEEPDSVKDEIFDRNLPSTVPVIQDQAERANHETAAVTDSAESSGAPRSSAAVEAAELTAAMTPRSTRLTKTPRSSKMSLSVLIPERGTEAEDAGMEDRGEENTEADDTEARLEPRSEFNTLKRHRWASDRFEHLVEWADGDETWLDEYSLHADCPSALQGYWKQRAEGCRPPNPRTDGEVYNVFAVRDDNKIERQLLVEWVGFKELTWEPSGDIRAANKEMVTDYFKEKRAARKQWTREQNAKKRMHESTDKEDVEMDDEAQEEQPLPQHRRKGQASRATRSTGAASEKGGGANRKGRGRRRSQFA